MNFRYLKLGLAALLFAGTTNSCSTGPDPEDIIDDVFTFPAKYCLTINNGINDIVMNVNAIVMNNLDTNKDVIDDEIPDGVTPTIYRTGEVIDSVVIDYGAEKTISSIGGKFKGKVVVDPADEKLQKFEIRLQDLEVNNFDVTGAFNFDIVGDVAGRDFSVSSSTVKFSITDSESNVTEFPVTSFEAAYKYVRSENDDVDYVDDIYNIISDIDITYPTGAVMSLTNQSDLLYAYACKNVIGGTALFTLQDIGEGIVNYGGGDTVDNCDGDASVTSQGSTITISL
ncbi:hypothetical protein [Marinifilum sp. D737]|uniref:hypothetical protein n=1 Tax=Marinifilum sp. D737 TaxID=2969628 RepID=UPI00227443B2|nr:hypothetical protein [Marinifilum sp. D737]MCY1632782.1 hypothetical protein [Marinifilum sp. D737]